MPILIKNITVLDGSGADAYTSDILIEGDKISGVGRGIAAPDARVIDGAGLCASPGFIDIHAHSEFSLLAEPAAPSKIMQGVTTEVSGNCGLSAAPMLGATRTAREKDLAELGLTIDWTDFHGFFGRMETASPAINFATLCGHGNVRGSVMGYADRRPDAGEMSKMKALLDDAMEAGALGLSTGLIYPPGVYSDTDEIVELAKVAAKRGGIYASHMRSEGARVVESVAETIDIGRRAGIPVQISHIKTSDPKNWGKVDDVIATVERARADGLDVTADRYPYTASSTDLDAILPAWAYEGGAAEELKRLNDPATRARMRADILRDHPDEAYWTNRVMVSSVVTEKNRHIEGMMLAGAAETLGLDPIDALFKILIDEDVRAGAIFFGMSEDNLRKFLTRDWVMLGSDSTARAMGGVTRQGKPHPRGFGSFPRVLGKFVREERLLTLPQAVRKMSAMQADRLRLAGRGYIRPGYYADLVVFDPGIVADTATFEDPYRFPAGIRHVIVNGELAVSDSVQTIARAGRVLKNAATAA